jgi:hypothetical protein
LYGLQGMSLESPAVRRLVRTLAGRIAASEAELDAQALSNALYGMQVQFACVLFCVMCARVARSATYGTLCTLGYKFGSHDFFHLLLAESEQ